MMKAELQKHDTDFVAIFEHVCFVSIPVQQKWLKVVVKIIMNL